MEIAIEESGPFEADGKQGRTLTLMGCRSFIYFYEKLDGPSEREFAGREGTFERIAQENLTIKELQGFEFLGMKLETGDLFVQKNSA